MKHQILLRIKTNHHVTRQMQLAGLLHAFKAGGNGTGIYLFRQFTRQTQDQRLVGTMSLAGSTQRTKQFDAYACKLFRQAIIRQPFNKHSCSTHGADGMRA